MPWDETGEWDALQEHHERKEERQEAILLTAESAVLPDAVVAVDLWDALIAHLHATCELQAKEMDTFIRRAMAGTRLEVPENHVHGPGCGHGETTTVPHPEFPDAVIEVAVDPSEEFPEAGQEAGDV